MTHALMAPFGSKAKEWLLRFATLIIEDMRGIYIYVCNGFCLSIQVLLNVTLLQQAAEMLEKDGAPKYIHGMNLVRLRSSFGHTTRSSPQLLVLQAKLYEQFGQA